MKLVYKLTFFLLSCVMVIFFKHGVGYAECPECVEVAKGGIPKHFLDKSIKVLPSGIPIWDNAEAIEALKDDQAKMLWVDTRPSSFLAIGTLLHAVNLVCDLKGVPIPEADANNAMTKERLIEEMKKIDPDISKVKVALFCQGPECHRSYDAALRCVSDYGFSPSQVIWFRDGYPNFEKYIQENPKLKKKITKYLRGEVVNQ